MLALPSGVVRASHLHATKKTAVALNLAGDCIQCVYFRRGKKGIYNLVVMSSKMNSNARMQDDMHRNTLYFKCG